MRLLSLILLLTAVYPATAGDLPDDWAFRPMGQPAAPPLRSLTSELQNPVDAFLLAKLQEKGLTFSPPADKSTLLRRVTFDLIGLPPTVEEQEAFLKDVSANAYEKVVDRLLASPRYGERMALGWLDLARFAESDGFKADDKRPLAWRYRDYVIKSFNDDKPYDRFIKEQLAGDELYSDDPDALIATAFLRHYPDEYNAVNLEQRRQEILNDITDTTAQAFMGITLGCAKCHDHKFDPISQEDYYGIQAFFAGWKPVQAPLLSGAKREAYEKQLHAWEEKTSTVRTQLDELEAPYRQKFSQKRRGRFPEEYAKLLDIPPEKRSPLEQQIAAMVEKQVFDDEKGMLAGIKPPEKERREELLKQLAAAGPKPTEPPTAMAMTDVGPAVPATYVLKRGNWRFKGKEVAPGFLSAIEEKTASVVVPSNKTAGRRTALAKWLTQPGNPLTARVQVNRLWQQHFGRGIVATPGDFGSQGERPTHPELLDWLAREFVAQWSLKHMHRLIVTSAAYRQGGQFNEAAVKDDPENKLLWRMNRRRLDGEAIRDAVLADAGLVNFKMNGPSVQPELPAEIKPSGWSVTPDAAERNRRSIYVYVKRNLRYPLFTAFDAPDRNEACSRRYVTTTAPQALMLLNEKLILDEAKTFAKRVLKEAGDKPEAVIERAFRLALGRLPSDEEQSALRAFLEKQAPISGGFEGAVTDLCHALMNVNEFVYVD
jgi:Protein of unknown function (DUF1553)/Protein of unknown function (DUF1549)